MSSSIDRLVAMANDIAGYFRSDPDRATAAAGVANHLRRFWEPRMRRKIAAYLSSGGAGLSDLARDGVSKIVADTPERISSGSEFPQRHKGAV